LVLLQKFVMMHGHTSIKNQLTNSESVAAQWK